MHRLALMTAIAAGLLAATPGAALEVSPDGRTAAVPAGAAATVVAVVAAAPYGSAPDWQNSLRVQVGGLAFGDLDGDGTDDLALGTYHSNSFPPYEDWHDYVFFNSGGTLEATPSWQSSDQQHTGDLGIADVDGDGRNDLVAARGGSAFDPSVVYFGQAGGLAAAPGWQSQVASWATGMALADIDGDGDTDLLTTNQGANQNDPYRPVYLFRNTGGVLGTAPDWQSGQSSIQNSVAVGDLDADGLPDLAVAMWVNFQSAAFANVAGTPASMPYWNTGTTAGDRGVQIADFDGDGHADIALGQDALRIFFGDGAGSFTPGWEAASTDSDHQSLAMADVNGDGLPDLATIDFARGKAWLYLSHDGALDPQPAWSYDGEGAGTALAFGDVNGDGRPDLALGFSGQPSAMVFLNQLAPPVDDPIFRNGFEPSVIGPGRR